MEGPLCQGRQGLMSASPELATRLPRKARTGGPLCPLSCIRGTEKRRIVDDCKGGYNFVSRMGGIASEILRRAMNGKISQYSQQRPQYQNKLKLSGFLLHTNPPCFYGYLDICKFKIICRHFLKEMRDCEFIFPVDDLFAYLIDYTQSIPPSDQ